MFPGIAACGTALDGPVWTLVPELIANTVYAVVVRWLTLPVLIAILVVCGGGIVAAELLYGTLDVGYNPTDQWAALARVGYSFFAGVVVFRFFGHQRVENPLASWLLVAALAAGLALQPSDDATPWFEIGAILIGFPLLLLLAGRYEPGPRVGKFFSVIGLISYGVYLLHQPMGNILLHVLRLRPLAGWADLIYGAGFIAVVMGFAWWLDGHYDAPVRKRLRAWLMPEKPKTA